ncbi:transmembrane and ubiquitin-like domain-containing protein 1 [Branchiostoma lanceolatum]|uniref:transmembrane and ubiquitin-like domain-containing protein 1 n=1 Tax=Branchiostoma lanceolatum TaxID=7740 RepID=UPI00345488E1
MALIEGVDDEITLIVAVLVIAVTLTAAWFSTYVAERPIPTERVGHLQTLHERIQGVVGETAAMATEGRTSDVQSLPPREENVGENVGGHVEPPEAQGSVENVQAEGQSGNSTSDASHDAVEENSQESSDKSHDALEGSPDPVQSSNSPTDHSQGSEETESPSEDAKNLECENSNSPTNITSDKKGDSKSAAGPSVCTRTSSETGSSMGHDPLLGAGVRGQERIEPGEGEIAIRLKFLNDQERVVYAKPEETISEFRRRFFHEEVQADHLVRFIYHGQVLVENHTLSSYGLNNNCVVHCQVTHESSPSQSTVELLPETEALDVGNFVAPLFGLIVSLVWYVKLQYPHLFNPTTSIALAAVTLLFLLGVIALYRTDRDEVQGSRGHGGERLQPVNGHE